MAMHKVFRRTAHARPLKDKVARQMAETFGRLIVDLRFQRKLSRNDVARRSGVPWNRMRVLEEGLRAPAIDELARLAQFYGVEAAELFGAALKGTDRLVAPMPEPKKPCMCEAMGSEGRAALRRVAQALEVLTS